MNRPRFRARAPHLREVDAERVAAWRDHVRATARRREAPAEVDVDEDPLLWCRWSWWPSPADRPGPYEPTIVVYHGGAAGRCLTYDSVYVRDTPLYRTPSFWRSVRPGVLFQIDAYPNGALGRHTATHRTREHERLGTWWPADPAPPIPMGIEIPPPAVVVVDVPGMGRVVAELAEARPGEAPVYAPRIDVQAAAVAAPATSNERINIGARQPGRRTR